MNPPVKLYVTTYCRYCRRAERLLEAKGVSFEEVDVTEDEAARAELVARTRWRTVPVIFVGDHLVGGFDELYALNKTGELDRLLAALAPLD
jgi:glutaredoxin 3